MGFNSVFKGLIGMMRHLDMQKSWIIGFLFENRLPWQFSTNSCFRLHIYLHTNKTLIHNSLYVFDSLGKNLSGK
jgi:hypothetical protein